MRNFRRKMRAKRRHRAEFSWLGGMDFNDLIVMIQPDETPLLSLLKREAYG